MFLGHFKVFTTDFFLSNVDEETSKFIEHKYFLCYKATMITVYLQLQSSKMLMLIGLQVDLHKSSWSENPTSQKREETNLKI